MLYKRTKVGIEEYRKYSSFFQNPVVLDVDLPLSPTNLEWKVNLGRDDYRKKQTKKAESFLTLPFPFSD
jgi:hypothetical protein